MARLRVGAERPPTLQEIRYARDYVHEHTPDTKDPVLLVLKRMLHCLESGKYVLAPRGTFSEVERLTERLAQCEAELAIRKGEPLKDV